MAKYRRTLRAVGLVSVVPIATSLSGQSRPPQPRLAYHIPAADSVTVRSRIEFRKAGDQALTFDLYLPPARSQRTNLPIVFLFNGVERAGFKDDPLNVAWGRLLAGAGFAAVGYDAHPQGTTDDFDALLSYLTRERATLGLDPDNVALWAGSANVRSALPLAGEPARGYIRAAVMYYGAADVSHFRLDLPVLLVRVGLDQPSLLRSLDSLVARALAANAPWTVISHPTGEHPFEQSSSLTSRDAIATTIQFLRLNLDTGLQRAIAADLPLARAGAAMQAGDWATAAQAYEELTARSPTDPEMARRLGDARLGAQQFSGAIDAYLRARQLGHWRRADIAIGLISAYAHAGRKADALAEIANLPTAWNKARLLDHPGFAPLRDDPDFIARMR